MLGVHNFDTLIFIFLMISCQPNSIVLGPWVCCQRFSSICQVFPLWYVSFQKPKGNHIIFMAFCQPGITEVLTDISSVWLISFSKCFIMELNSILSSIGYLPYRFITYLKLISTMIFINNIIFSSVSYLKSSLILWCDSNYNLMFVLSDK